mmetsp:Transcript_71884/g.114472  ORF Transcript_71884/g.114472 Transcript_71884/m.114472 type:complete len:267 (+) Transcript_71884:1583-2383(+)
MRDGSAAHHQVQTLLLGNSLHFDLDLLTLELHRRWRFFFLLLDVRHYVFYLHSLRFHGKSGCLDLLFLTKTQFHGLELRGEIAALDLLIFGRLLRHPLNLTVILFRLGFRFGFRFRFGLGLWLWLRFRLGFFWRFFKVTVSVIQPVIIFILVHIDLVTQTDDASHILHISVAFLNATVLDILIISVNGIPGNRWSHSSGSIFSLLLRSNQLLLFELHLLGIILVLHLEVPHCRLMLDLHLLHIGRSRTNLILQILHLLLEAIVLVP